MLGYRIFLLSVLFKEKRRRRKGKDLSKSAMGAPIQPDDLIKSFNPATPRGVEATD